MQRQTALISSTALTRRTAACLFLLAVSATLTAATPSPNEANMVIQSTIETLRSALRREMRSTNPIDRVAVSVLVDEIVLPHIDIDLSGRLILGRHWRTASGAERQAFIDGYRALLLRVYAVHAADYMDAEVRILNSVSASAEKLPLGTPTLTVRTRVTRPGKPVASVDYRMTVVEGSWKIFDAVVNGVSIVGVLRIAVNEEIGRYGLSGLNEKLTRRPDLPSSP